MRIQKLLINDTQAYYEIAQGRWLEPVIKSDLIAVRVIDFVWTIYQRRSGEELSTLAHQKGVAWDQVKQQQPLLRNANIPDALIKDEFLAIKTQLLKTNNSVASQVMLTE